MHLFSWLMRRLIVGLLVAPVVPVGPGASDASSASGGCARVRGSTAHQRCSFRGEAMPAFWSFRLVSLRFRKFECLFAESLMLGNCGSQANTGEQVWEPEILSSRFPPTARTGRTRRAPHGR
jgi:hypothetical protein